MSLLVLLMSLAFGQAYEANPCKAEPEINAQLDAGVLGALSGMGPEYRLVTASSMLPASPKKKPPAPPDPSTMDRLDALEVHAEAAKKVDAWTCTYGPTNLVDGRLETAWSEGAKGLGIGEVVIVPLPKGQVEIRAGYAKSAQRWAENGRPSVVEVMVLGSGWMAPVQYDLYADLPVMGRHTVKLRDVDAWQPLPLPAVAMPADYLPQNPDAPKAQEPAYLAIRIVEAVPGSKWQDVLISEVRGSK